MSDQEDYELEARRHNAQLEGYHHHLEIEDEMLSQDEINTNKRAMAHASQLLDHLICMVKAHEASVTRIGLPALREVLQPSIALIERVTGKKWE